MAFSPSVMWALLKSITHSSGHVTASRSLASFLCFHVNNFSTRIAASVSLSRRPEFALAHPVPGDALGDALGLVDGLSLGDRDGEVDGLLLGLALGLALGLTVGASTLHVPYVPVAGSQLVGSALQVRVPAHPSSTQHCLLVSHGGHWLAGAPQSTSRAPQSGQS